jgi:hypothetical protein
VRRGEKRSGEERVRVRVRLKETKVDSIRLQKN